VGKQAENMTKHGVFEPKAANLADFSMKSSLCILLALIAKMDVDLSPFERWNVQSY